MAHCRITTSSISIISIYLRRLSFFKSTLNGHLWFVPGAQHIQNAAITTTQDQDTLVCIIHKIVANNGLDKIITSVKLQMHHKSWFDKSHQNDTILWFEGLRPLFTVNFLFGWVLQNRQAVNNDSVISSSSKLRVRKYLCTEQRVYNLVFLRIQYLKHTWSSKTNHTE